MLMTLICARLNFSGMLTTELWAPTFDTSYSEQLVFPNMVALTYKSQNSICIDAFVDPELATTFKQFQYISILFNTHYHDRMPVDESLFHECIAFMQSSLSRLNSWQGCQASRCIYLGMAVLFATTFRIPGVYTHPCCATLADAINSSCISLEGSVHNLPESVILWLTFACLMSTNDMSEVGIPASWRRSLVRRPTWQEVRQQLKQVYWIDSFHDDLGRKAYETLMI